jgi:hypothetical protein
VHVDAAARELAVQLRLGEMTDAAERLERLTALLARAQVG